MLRIGWLGTYVETRHDDSDEVVGQGDLPVDIVHAQDLLVSEARVSADVGLPRGFAASLMVPVRVVGSSIRYLDPGGAEVQLVTENIHHRNETVSGIGDPMLLGSASSALGGWRLTARAGITIPLGRTEEDPFALGEQGIRHQHIQLGTGTVNPVLALEAARSWGRWRFGAFGLSQQVVYENSRRYQAGDRYAGGVVLRYRLGERWGVRGGVDAVGESAERWNGMEYSDEGNRGRFDLIAGLGASWSATKQLSVDASLKVPVVTHAVGGQLDMPAIVEVGASWSFGGAKARGGHEHAHEHGEHAHEHDAHEHDAHEHGERAHEHGAHEHGEHEHGEHEHGEVAHVDTTGLDVVDVGKPGEAVDLVPVPGKLTIFDFWATWCEPCKILEPVLFQLAREHPGVVAIRRVDAADWDSPVVARHLTPKGFGLPHLKIFDPSGRMILERSSESGKLEELIQAVRKLVEAEAAKPTPAPVTAPAPAPAPRPAPPRPAPPKAAPPPSFSITVTPKGFEPANVKVPAGKPVTLRFLRTTEKTCATEVVMEVAGKKIVKDLPLNKLVELTVTIPRPGRVGYACAMDMIRGSIIAE